MNPTVNYKPILTAIFARHYSAPIPLGTEQQLEYYLKKADIPVHFLADLNKRLESEKLTAEETSRLQYLFSEIKIPQHALQYLNAPRDYDPENKDVLSREKIYSLAREEFLKNKPEKSVDYIQKSKTNLFFLSKILLVTGATALMANSVEFYNNIVETSAFLTKHISLPNIAKTNFIVGAALSLWMLGDSAGIAVSKKIEANSKGFPLEDILSFSTTEKSNMLGYSSAASLTASLKKEYAAIPDAQKILLGHLSNQDKAYFLLSDNKTREDILISNPPPRTNRILAFLRSENETDPHRLWDSSNLFRASMDSAKIMKIKTNPFWMPDKKFGTDVYSQVQKMRPLTP